MEPDTLHFTTEVDPTGAVIIAAEGYLDAEGGARLGREADAAVAAGHTHLLIDLEEVVLFNCAGAREMLAALEELRQSGGHVDVVGVHPPLRRALHFSA
jgi:anti-anti-sigma factor